MKSKIPPLQAMIDCATPGCCLVCDRRILKKLGGRPAIACWSADCRALVDRIRGTYRRQTNCDSRAKCVIRSARWRAMRKAARAVTRAAIRVVEVAR